MNNLRIKKGDNVVVIAGKDKGKNGLVLAVAPKLGKVMVEGVNIVTRAKKARTPQEQSGLIKQEAFIDASNVMIICATCGKATRIAKKEINGENTRVCKKCGADLSVKAAKATKKPAAKKVEEKVEEKAPVAKKTTTAKKATTTAAAKKPAATKEVKEPAAKKAASATTAKKATTTAAAKKTTTTAAAKKTTTTAAKKTATTAKKTTTAKKA